MTGLYIAIALIILSQIIGKVIERSARKHQERRMREAAQRQPAARPPTPSRQEARQEELAARRRAQLEELRMRRQATVAGSPPPPGTVLSPVPQLPPLGPAPRPVLRQPQPARQPSAVRTARAAPRAAPTQAPWPAARRPAPLPGTVAGPPAPPRGVPVTPGPPETLPEASQRRGPASAAGTEDAYAMQRFRRRHPLLAGAGRQGILRQAVLLRELLDPPVALRDPFH